MPWFNLNPFSLSKWLCIKKLIEDGFLPAGLTIGPSSVGLTLLDPFSCPKPGKDTKILGESVPHQQV